MIITIGNHQLFTKGEPEMLINKEKGIITIILLVEDNDGKTYELHYICSTDDPDLIINKSKFVEL